MSSQKHIQKSIYKVSENLHSAHLQVVKIVKVSRWQKCYLGSVGVLTYQNLRYLKLTFVHQLKL